MTESIYHVLPDLKIRVREPSSAAGGPIEITLASSDPKLVATGLADLYDKLVDAGMLTAR